MAEALKLPPGAVLLEDEPQQPQQQPQQPVQLKGGSGIDDWLRQQSLTKPLMEHFDQPPPSPLPPGGAVPTRTTEGMGMFEQAWQAGVVTPAMRLAAGLRSLPRMMYEIGRGDFGMTEKPGMGILNDEIGWTASAEPPNPDIAAHLPTMQEVQRDQYAKTGIPVTEATSAPGRVAQKGMEALLGTVIGVPPGASQAGPIVAGAVGSQVAGQTAREMGVPEPIATGIEIVGGVAGPSAVSKIGSKAADVGGALGRRVTAPHQNAAAGIMNQMAGSATAAQREAALALMRRAQAEGVSLSLPQAMQHVTQGGTPGLANLQRVVEAAPGGEGLKGAMTQQTGQFRQQLDQNTQNQPFRDPVTGDMRTTLSPEAKEGLPGAIQGRAEQALQRQREGRRGQTQPQYQGAEGTSVDDYYFAPDVQSEWQSYFNRPTMRREIERMHSEKVGAGQPVHRWLTFDEEGRLTGNVGVPRPNEVDEIVKDLQMQIDKKKGDVGYIAENDPLVFLKNGLERMAYRDIPNYETARFTHRETSPGLDRAQEGTLGAMANASGATPDAKFMQQMSALMPKNPKATTPEGVRAVLRQLQGGDASGRRGLRRRALDPTMQQAVNTYLKGQWDEIARATKTNNLSEGAGAGFRAWMAGNPQQAQMLRAVIEETQGPERWRAVENMLTFMEASGNRMVPGSQTTFNQAIMEMLQAPSFGVAPADVGVGVMTGGASIPFRAAQGFENVQRLARGQKRTKHLADMMMDPNLAPLWNRVATVNPASPNAARLIGGLLGMGIGATTEPPAP